MQNTDSPEYLEMLERPCLWHRHPPAYVSDPDSDEPQAKYLIAVRSPFDDKRETRKSKHARGGGFEEWKKDKQGTPEDWAERFLSILQNDPVPRTFNQLGLEATDLRQTADVLFDGPAERGIWLLVEQQRACWTDGLLPGTVWFSLSPSESPSSDTASSFYF